MAHTAAHIAKNEKKKAQNTIDKYKNRDKSKLGPRQLAAFEGALATRKNAGVVIKASAAAGREDDAGDLRTEHDRLMGERADAQKALDDAIAAGKTKGELTDLRTALFQAGLRASAYGDEMRGITGRQMGQGTAYTGPGMRIALDEEGKIKRDDQGRIVYDVDSAAYEKRFRPTFQPTEEQKTMWKELFPESEVAITEGLLTPWQQVNMQWMTGTRNKKGELITDLTGIEATDKQIKLFGDTLKEGRIPKEWREAWRTETWGDVKDTDPNSPTYGLWTPSTGEARKQVVAQQQERYDKGYFNPTTGKPGQLSQWGEGTGLISPEDFIPKDWPGPGAPVPELGITGDPWGTLWEQQQKVKVDQGPAGDPGVGSDYMLAYRPGTRRYWDQYMGDKQRQSLMKFQSPKMTQAALSYLPGEQRDPKQWAQFIGMGGLGTKTRKLDNQFQGFIPQGSWRRSPDLYKTAAADYKGGPWAFAARPSPAIAQQMWTPYNLPAAQVGEWKGLLGDWAAPALNTTNLLGEA